MDNMDEFWENMNKLSKAMQESSKEREKECDYFWSNLSMEDREKVFYSVVKRLYKGDVEDGGSYRYVLYDVFGFDMNMYTDGMDCGYMDIHNYIIDGKDFEQMNRINRLEVIDDLGRSYVKYFNKGDVEYQLQDDGKTLKIFIGKDEDEDYQTQFDF